MFSVLCLCVLLLDFVRMRLTFIQHLGSPPGPRLEFLVAFTSWSEGIYSTQFVSSRFAQKLKFKFDIQSFPKCQVLCFTDLFERKVSSHFVRKF